MGQIKHTGAVKYLPCPRTLGVLDIRLMPKMINAVQLL